MIPAMQDDLVRRHRLTVQDYYRMAEVGLLAPEARVELIEGEIIDMPPSGPPHAGVVSLLYERLFAGIQGQAIVRPQLALHLDDFSEPEPDLVLVKAAPDHYVRSHPTAADALLVVEVSQSSLGYDRNRKLPLYARHGIPEVWIVDLMKLRLHRFDGPQGERYLHTATTPRPGVFELEASPGMQVDLTGLFAGLQGP